MKLKNEKTVHEKSKSEENSMNELALSELDESAQGESCLLEDIYEIINSARDNVAKRACTEIAMMNWHIGERINREILGNSRAEYGKQIVSRVATQLKETFGGSNFSVRNLRRMMQFASEFPDTEIVSRLATQLSWSHFIEVLPIKEPLQREFYLTVAASEHWSRDLMREKIDGMLYERTAISGKPEEMISKELADLRDNNILTPDLVFKDPYFLDFTGLTGFYSEKDLEDMLISQLEKFLIELEN